MHALLLPWCAHSFLLPGSAMIDSLLQRYRSLLLLPLLLVLVLLLLPPGAGVAAETIRSEGQFPVTVETLKAKIEAVRQSSGLDEDSRNRLLELYRKGVDNLSAAKSNSDQAKALANSIETAPAEIQKLKQTLRRQAEAAPIVSQPAAEERDARSLKELEQELLKARAVTTEIEASVADLTRQGNLANDRPAKISQRLVEIKEILDKGQPDPTTVPQASESSELKEARELLRQSQLVALNSEARMLNQEMVSIPVIGELLALQREEAASRMEQARQQMQALETKVNRKRQDEASQRLGEAKEVVAQLTDQQPLLQRVAQGNATYSERLLESAAAVEAIVAEREGVEKALKRVDEALSSTKQKIAMAGRSQALGLLLHDLQRSLPNKRQLNKTLNHNREVIAETGLVQVQLGEERKKLDDIDGYVEELTSDLAPAEVTALRPELRTLLANRADLLDKIMAANRAHLSQLSEIELLSTNLLNTVDDFNSLLAERLLWIRSTPMLQARDFVHLPEEIHTLLAPAPWLATGRLLLQQALVSPLFFLACAAFLGLVGARGWLATRLEHAVNLAGNPATYQFHLPIKALALTVLLALPLPLLCFSVGWQLHSLGEASEFARSVGGALVLLATRFFYLRIFMVLLRPIGVATRIFFWPHNTVRLLRRETGRFLLAFPPAIFFTQLAFYVNYRAGASHILGRLSMLLLLAIITIFAFRLFHPRTGVWSSVGKTEAAPFFTRLNQLLFTANLIVPVIMTVLVLGGYVFAVGGLLRCLVNSIWLTFALVVCHQLLERWLIQSSRQLTLQKIMQRRTLAAGREETRQPPREQEQVEAEPEEDLVVLSQESRKLLNALITVAALVGLWLVWFDMLPALRIFNQYTLWTNTGLVNGQTAPVPVTVADAGMTLLIGCLTLVATRHLPALLKIILLKRLQMSAGSRYTVVTLTRYGIGGAGLLYIADVLGFSWSQIQWLVAALGVGIGFGLQEIVANFISGIIILFERPIRVGDVVTIGTTDGVVTRIRIRATTIRDFDGKELLVPNKEFISGRLLNWSLSDPVLRILLPVGVAYGSDVAGAMELMRQAAENHPQVLEEPKPTVTFDNFGDNALQLNLRCFIGSVDERVRVRSELHLAIDQAFRQAGITMAFPQRDVHVDTVAPLSVRIVREEQEKTGKGQAELSAPILPPG